MKNRIIVSVCVLVLLLASVVQAAAPGSEGDPVVTLSYITDKVVPEIQEYIDRKVSAAEIGQLTDGAQASTTFGQFEVVTVASGQTLLCDAGTELILRQGQATVLASQKGGIADVTAGADLADGADAPANHHLIVPVNDGRGLAFTADGIVMLRGSYLLK